MKFLILIAIVCSGAANAAGLQPSYRIYEVAKATFIGMPPISRGYFDPMTCGGDGDDVNPYARFCSSERRIYINYANRPDIEVAYEVAHLLGHAVQVKIGIADIALAAITSEPEREQELRAMVTRQVECIGGVLFARAGVDRTSLKSIFTSEPFVGRHWGRNPLRRAPKVKIGLDERDKWFLKGQDAAEFSVCADGDISSDLLVSADQLKSAEDDATK